MSIIANMATERARRDTDRVLDAVDQIKVELERAPREDASIRLNELADRLLHAGITMLAATAVMAEEFEQRLCAARPVQQRAIGRIVKLRREGMSLRSISAALAGDGIKLSHEGVKDALAASIVSSDITNATVQDDRDEICA
jgi:hypothetical protein